MNQVFGSPRFAPFLSETTLPQRLEKWPGLLRSPALRLLMAGQRFEGRPPHGCSRNVPWIASRFHLVAGHLRFAFSR